MCFHFILLALFPICVYLVRGRIFLAPCYPALAVCQDFWLTLVLISLDSPRIYVSTNPWKITATFQTVSSTREEYLGVVEKLKSSSPGDRKGKLEQVHTALVKALESRIEIVDAELAVSILFLLTGDQ